MINLTIITTFKNHTVSAIVSLQCRQHSQVNHIDKDQQDKNHTHINTSVYHYRI